MQENIDLGIGASPSVIFKLGRAGNEEIEVPVEMTTSPFGRDVGAPCLPMQYPTVLVGWLIGRSHLPP
jgi:hypothetical protein